MVLKKQKKSKKVTICISSTGKTLNSRVDFRFGRCQYFLIIDNNTGKFKAIPNAGLGYNRGAGISAAQVVADQGIDAIITGNIGPNAFMVLNNIGIKIYAGISDKTCKQALEMFNDGKLSKIQSPNGLGMSFGLGRGGFGPGNIAGRGRGRGGR